MINLAKARRYGQPVFAKGDKEYREGYSQGYWQAMQDLRQEGVDVPDKLLANWCECIEPWREETSLKQ